MKDRTIVSFDWALKRLLRNKANFEVLEGFLSELLKRQIRVKQILESEGNKETADAKTNRVDMLVVDETEELMIIELQYEYEIDYLHRMLFGTSKVITDHIVKKQTYGNIKKVYSINIVYFNLGKGDDYVYHGKTHFRGIHTDGELQLTAAQRAKFGKTDAGDIYPEYYILNVKDFNNVAKDNLDEWIYYLKNDKIKDNFKAQGLDKAREILAYDQLSPQEQQAYDKEIDRLLGLDNAIYSARIEGKYEGKAEGKAEGEVIGIEKGKVMGKAENLAEVALTAHRAGFSIEQIQSFTGLSKEQIEEIIKQAENL